MIRELYNKSRLPWSILGDFNDLMYSHEKQGRHDHPRWLLDGFKKVIEECHLTDMGFLGYEFTWERSRGTETWIQERLDRGFSNHDWTHMFPHATIKVLDVSVSDHLPIFLELNMKIYVPKKKSSVSRIHG